MSVQSKLKEFEKQGYHHIDEQTLTEYLTYRWQQQNITSFFAKRRDLKNVTANDVLDYEQMKVEMTDEASFNWHQIDDLF